MAESALSPLTQLFIKISNSLSEEDVRSLRVILAREGLGKAKVEQATALEMFYMLEEDDKIGKGKLQFLVEVLRSLGKGRLADEAEQLEQKQRGQGRESQNPEEVDESAVKTKTPVKAGVSRINQGVENLRRKLTATGGEGVQEQKAIKGHGSSTACQIAGNRTLQPSRPSQVSSGFLLASAGFTMCVEVPAIESLPCSVTVTADNTADLTLVTGGDVTPQIEVTSPQGKTTLIHTTEQAIEHTGPQPRPYTSPPLAANQRQTDRVRRVWVGEWRPQESGNHSLGVCMGGKKDLGSLTVDVGSNNPVLRFGGQEGSQQGQFDGPVSKYTLKKKAPVKVGVSKITQGVENLGKKLTSTGGEGEQVRKEIKEHSLKPQEEQETDKVQKDRAEKLPHQRLKEVSEKWQLKQEDKKEHLSSGFSRSHQISAGSLSVFAGFSIDVQEPAVESLPCSVTVTANTEDLTADLTGGDVTPQIEVTSPQGKTTLIQTTAHSSPPLAAGKGQTSRVRRVWGGVWRPQESGKHTLEVCMGGLKDLGSLTVDVGSNNPVLRFGQKGSQQGQFNTPMDVAVRGDRLYVADTCNKRVQVFDLSGKFFSSFSTITCPGSVAVQTDGSIVVNSGFEVMKFSPSGKLLHTFPLGEYCTNPYGLAVQRDGRVVVADPDKHSIFLFEADWTLVKQVGGKGWGDGQFHHPAFVCVDKEDNIIVADTDNCRVQVFDKNLNFKHKFGQFGRQPQDMWGPAGVSADSRGNIVLANVGDDSGVGGVEHGRKLQVFCPNGMWVSTISSDGDKLNFPHGVAVTEDGHVFVADPFDYCIRKYRYM
ncbi:uncharacterized protein LOC144860462 [Branchiostoma floridae x Branchiostoma japonicum]